jgi:hypothetical protein
MSELVNDSVRKIMTGLGFACLEGLDASLIVEDEGSRVVERFPAEEFKT